MTQLDTKPTEPDKQRRSMVPWLVAAVAVLVFGVAITLLTRDTNEVPPGTEPIPTTTPEAAPTTTVSSEDAEMALALEFADAMYLSDGEALAALPWASEETSKDVTWVSEFSAVSNAEVVDSSCQRGSATIICEMTLTDDISKAVGKATSYKDTFVLRFDESGEQIISAQWRTFQTGDLSGFFTWTGTNTELYFADGDCKIENGRPAECALAFLDLTSDYLADS